MNRREAIIAEMAGIAAAVAVAPKAFSCFRAFPRSTASRQSLFQPFLAQSGINLPFFFWRGSPLFRLSVDQLSIALQPNQKLRCEGNSGRASADRLAL
jgi:hypothetical protein